MIVIVTAFLALAVLLVLTAYRRLPDAADRIVAADALSACAIAFCLVAAAEAKEPAYLDVAIGIALVAFLATVGWSSALVAHTESDAGSRDERS